MLFGPIFEDRAVPFTLPPDANGILPDRMIAAMADAGLILPAYPFVESQIQPASLDLRLGDIAYRVRASFLPGPGRDRGRAHRRVEAARNRSLRRRGAGDQLRLHRAAAGKPRAAAARSSRPPIPKSSTGRLDVFTRVIADGTRRFDMIGAGYHGPLYAEISPKTFPVLLREGSRLSQVRFRTGDAILNADELDALHDAERLVDIDDADLANGVALSVDLSGENTSGFVGYRAKRHTGVVDIDRRGGYAVDEFWEPIAARPDGSLILDPGEFYILASKEAVQVPPDYAAEMVPFDPLVGEFRVHYAGFFDPGFGYAGAGGQGSRAVLEVRSREVPFILEHGQIVGRLVYEKMLSRPDAMYGQRIGSNYQAQGLKLSKHFRV